jgi:hypothetical protein
MGPNPHSSLIQHRFIALPILASTSRDMLYIEIMTIPIIFQSSNDQPGAQQQQPNTGDTGEVQGPQICSQDSEMIQEGAGN